MIDLSSYQFARTRLTTPALYLTLLNTRELVGKEEATLIGLITDVF